MGAYATIVCNVVVIGYLLVGITSLTEKYTLIGNLLPEIAGLMVVGRWAVEWMIHPYQKLSYETTMISKLYTAKASEGELPDDEDNYPSCFCCL